MPGNIPGYWEVYQNTRKYTRILGSIPEYKYITIRILETIPGYIYQDKESIPGY